MAKVTTKLEVPQKLDALAPEERLGLFDAATARQREREKCLDLSAEAPAERDWKREDLYTRGKTR